MYKRIVAMILTLILLTTPLSLATQTVYASDAILHIGDYTTWSDVASAYGNNTMQFLKGIADSLGMSCSAFCSAVSSGAVSLAPYLMGAVAIGSACYLGYDLYTNWDEICDQVHTQLSGGSAYADWWYENYGAGIINGSEDLAKGIKVPISMFKDMTVALSDVLTQDLTVSFTHGKTICRTSNSTITDNDILVWLSGLGYTGTVAHGSGSVNPVICMYNASQQDYVIYRAGNYYNAGFKDLFVAEAGGTIYMQLQDKAILSDDAVGYTLRDPGDKDVMWRAFNAANGNTLDLKPRFSVTDMTINRDNGVMTYATDDTVYTLSILVPQGCSVALGNIAYSALEFPLSYKLGYSYYDLLPYYYQVTALSIADASLIGDKINAKTHTVTVPREYIDAIDDAITAGDDVPLVLPWEQVADYVNNDVPDTTEITREIGKSIDDSANNTTSPNVFHVVVDGLLDILKEFAYWLFVPSDGFMDGFLADMTATYEQSTGVLTYPIVALIQFLNRLTAIDNVDAVLTIPDITWKDCIIFPAQSINLTAYIRDNKDIQSLYNYYLIFCRGLLVFCVLSLARKKQEEMTRG